MPGSRLSQHPAGVLGSALDWKILPSIDLVDSLLFDWPSTQAEEQGLLAGHLKTKIHRTKRSRIRNKNEM